MSEGGKTAVVTGAGSGVGRAVVTELLDRGWRVALIGRREAPLKETAAGSPRASVHPCDVGDASSVDQAAAAILQAFSNRVDALVNAAGTNLPDRRLDQMTPGKWRAVMAANLDGPYYLVHAFLPAMRARHSGTVVNVNSLAGLRASALSGVAYSASKAGLTALAESINAEENATGLRATGVYPGDIDTPLLEKRPNMPPPGRRAKMLTPADVAACVLLAIDLPDRAVVERIIVRPRE